MARKRFLADVIAASKKGISHVVSISRGDDDGDVNFCFLHDSAEPIEIGLLALDVSEYPSGNSFMVFTKSDGAPKAVIEVLNQLTPSPYGVLLPDLISSISQKLQKALSTGSRESSISLDDDDEDDVIVDVEEGSEDDSGFSDEEEEDFPDEPISFSNGQTVPTSTIRISPEAAAELNRRIRADLRTARMLGHRIGILSGMKAESQGSILSISIQATKLGLSEEAMQAWDIEPDQYLTLLIRYSDGYKTFEKLIAEPAKNSGIDFRVGVSNGYKPSAAAAFSAFSDSNKVGFKAFNDDSSASQANLKNESRGFSSIFISSSLNEFFNTKMLSILKIRNATGLGWEDAKQYLDERQGRPLEENIELLSEKFYPHADTLRGHTSRILTDDHLTDNNGGNLSFPLLAAQFALMYLVRCTEFCLVCHDKITAEFEALKPYVCDKPLCLYQYMALGFGPSVEHEIQSQPYVVDLLLNFCYTSACGGRIREYPTGMSLSVPFAIGQAGNIVPPGVSPAMMDEFGPPANSHARDKEFDIKYDAKACEITFEGNFENKGTPIRRGDWVRILVVPAPGYFTSETIHCRVEDINSFPIAKLSPPIVQKAQASTYQVPSAGHMPAVNSPNIAAARLAVYDCNFDDMSVVEKCSTIAMLLDTLPTIKELREYIDRQSQTEEPNLRKWAERISPAALGLLRWVIASNRSCLVQVDRCPGQIDSVFSDAKIRPDQKVSQIGENWVQFRFAQGSPDKELRFLNALKAQQAHLNPNYPTIFAFHGSALQNWHSIIRHGLDFKETLNGRAFGHGVYHAQNQTVSCTYTGRNFSGCWPGSQLNATAVMSINEIINCPQQFVSSNPYIVVQHIDWIQCRYLLVKIDPNAADEPSPNSSHIAAANEIKQDPKYTARSTNGKPIGVPHCAGSISRAFCTDSVGSTSQSKKRKGLPSSVNGATFFSDEEDIEDTKFLLLEDEGDIEVLFPTFKKPEAAKTDFVPGSLDQSSLPILDSPAYATPSATMRLNRELQTILKIQKSTPLHELGWYIDEALVDNIYQWIVELHSFDSTLPLAKDLKESGQTSVVIEIRFGKEYPHSPPFVRVVKPRFLPFMSGGGGHVTGGGALCMELLTNTGWSAVSSIESVLLQVRLALMSTEPKPARLEHRGKQQQGEYGTQEAMAAFIRACSMHGWEIPKDFQDFAAIPGSSRS
ncbi:9b27a76f-85a1-4450-a8c9-cd0173dd82b2 [Sclerotinia trifoliorum]|uniref:9b27a76f-85a1-4450-a8c9-cd0173dd82b2 n=1 Tax=Sclerotinia trifoliorum TaxID=28548 RepID=A0A8H2VP43_9HELO|nr:9b27a76f-85a1-4450-a8c9-cd0173dd82b2 [Sclerotinia trifoliorum]